MQDTWNTPAELGPKPAVKLHPETRRVLADNMSVRARAAVILAARNGGKVETTLTIQWVLTGLKLAVTGDDGLHLTDEGAHTAEALTEILREDVRDLAARNLGADEIATWTELPEDVIRELLPA